MTRSQLENLLRAASELAGDRDFFLIGSQALRGICPVIPKDFPKTHRLAKSATVLERINDLVVHDGQKRDLLALLKQLVAEQSAEKKSKLKKARK